MAAKKRSTGGIQSGRARAARARKPSKPSPPAKAVTKKPVVKKPATRKPAAKPAATQARTGGSARERRPAAALAESAARDGLNEGDLAPSFELPDSTGGTLSAAALAGQPYVIYFYPKDDTPGCTAEACGFRDAQREFEDAGVRVLGVSPDSGASHEKFRAKYSLNFTLLSDPEHTAASAFGVWAKKKNYGREYMGVVRSTFLVGADGRIQKAWRGVRVPGHVNLVAAAARELS